ncbi:hypothetical protein PHLCEN_2v9169 [Hermanssonia centrifuga]|uniref:Helicase C-terminal domain-containing protein n=1 Tax=Hermanssonia centrifuga TaxID=98765 RepID=A0A2R6NRL1_9APHY|nr:hypothetical protein PHLCEN_2v9169 [Hermanssonia centrifuga]
MSHVLQLFHDGSIKILCAFPKGIVGLEVDDIRRVVQFLVPESLREWIRRCGYAGRDGKPSTAILFAEPFEEEKPPQTRKREIKPLPCRRNAQTGQGFAAMHAPSDSMGVRQENKEESSVAATSLIVG